MTLHHMAKKDQLSEYHFHWQVQTTVRIFAVSTAQNHTKKKKKMQLLL